MRHQHRNLQTFLDDSFARFRKVTPEEVEPACNRVLDRLREEAEREPTAVRPDFRYVRRRWSRRRLAVGGAAAAIVLAFLFTQMRPSRNSGGVIDANAVMEMADGSSTRIAEGQTVSAGDTAGAVLSLADASSVEMRSQSELSVERADDGIRIRLNKGNVIVNAAGQRAGHLYVQTKDVTVTVVGTVFLVSVEETGSRVAVIEGEVHVQQGTTERDLLPGQQLATNPVTESRPVSEQISWSRKADAHLALLEQPCGPGDMRTIWQDNGGLNLRLPGFIWRKYKCLQALRGQ